MWLTDAGCFMLATPTTVTFSPNSLSIVGTSSVCYVRLRLRRQPFGCGTLLGVAH